MWIEHTALSELMDFSKKFYRDSYPRHKDMGGWPPPNLWRCDFPFILLQILNQDQVIRYAGASTARLSNKRIVGHGQELARKELWSWAAQQLRSRTDSRHYLLVLAGGPTWNPKSEICRQERNLNSTFCMSLARTQPAVKGRSPILKSSSAFSPPLHTKKEKNLNRFKNLMKYSLNDRFIYTYYIIWLLTIIKFKAAMIVATLNFPSVFICCLFLLLSCASLLILNAKVIERRTTLWQGELKGGERWRGCGRGSGPGNKNN